MQVTYLLVAKETVERKFGAYKNIKDNYHKYVVSLSEVNFSQEGIIHMHIKDFLLTENL